MIDVKFFHLVSWMEIFCLELPKVGAKTKDEFLVMLSEQIF